MEPTCITLLTDFGWGDHYVGALKGVLLGINPRAHLVDLTHEIEPQNVRQGSLVLAQAAPWFPPGTVHLAVVDPGVGTPRAIVCASIGGQMFVAPDNGLLTAVARQQPVDRAVRVTESAFFHHPVCNTFHARDIMAPVAAHLSLGLPMRKLGPPVACLEQWPWPTPRCEAQRVQGEVLYTDRFGNVVTNIPRGLLEHAPDESVQVSCGGHTVGGMRRTYADVGVGEGVALFGSSDLLEIAVRNGSAAQQFRLSIGDPVAVVW